VRTRSRYISLAKALVRRDGLRVAASEPYLVATTSPRSRSPIGSRPDGSSVHHARPDQRAIAAADRGIAELTRTDPAVALLTTAPLIGPITASAMVATIDDVTRFSSAHQFAAFLGLVPDERSSGEKRRVGRLTKTGNARMRSPPGRGGVAHPVVKARRDGGAGRVRAADC
jgi:hypothetical protein